MRGMVYVRRRSSGYINTGMHAPITLHATLTKAAPSHIKAFNYGRPLNYLLTHVILVRVACGSNIQAGAAVCNIISAVVL